MPSMKNAVRAGALATVLIPGGVYWAIPPGPAGSRLPPGAPQVSQEQVLRGRTLIITHACGDCHGGFENPAAEGFLAGMRNPLQDT